MSFIEVDTNVRDAIRCHIIMEYTYHDFTTRLGNYLREFRRNSLDQYSDIQIVLPQMKVLEFRTPNRTGPELTLVIRSWKDKAPPEFQKKRWWTLFREWKRTVHA